MGISPRDIIIAAVGFVLVAILTPIGMSILVTYNTSFNTTTGTGTATSATLASTFAPVYTMFTILLPVLYIISAAIYFIPRIHGE